MHEQFPDLSFVQREYSHTIELSFATVTDTSIISADFESSTIEYFEQDIPSHEFLVPHQGQSLGGAKRGIWLQNGNQNSFYNNVVVENIDEGLYLSDTSANVFVNNYFNNNVNAVFGPSVGANTWNLTQSSQRSITGGRSSGGNFWGQPDGNGFSQVTPGTRDICDQPYVLATSNVDRLPLK